MAKLVVLNLVKGDFERTGFPVILQIMEEGKSPDFEDSGHLPPNPEIPQNYHDWQSSYLNFLGIQSQPRLGKKLGQITQFSILDVREKAQTLSENLNKWLKSNQFSHLREELALRLPKDEVARIAIKTSQLELWKLPWNLWDLLTNYPNAEVSICPPRFEQVTSSPGPKSQVLVILGGDVGIDVQEDEKKLKSLLGDRVRFLVKPNRQQLSDRLWEQPWDMLFFSGHSHTEGETGAIYINDTEKLTIDDLRYGLQKAIKSGLQLAIFNSCDGLGLAKDLADLNLPQMIVMREPVPDIVAQEFLKYFLDSFSTGKPFHLAVREAREQLQWLEDRFPCATWLPAIVQNVTAKTFQWKQPSTKWRQICQKMLESRVTSNLLTVKQGVSFTDLDRIYVDLALVERRKQEKRESNIPAEKGSELYKPEYEATQRFEHQQFLQQILGLGQGKTQGRRVAIVGEPGAGKTTTLQKIARWLLSENQLEDYLPIWVSLAELGEQNLEEYLFETWLTRAIGKRRLTEEVEKEFETQLEAGRVWLLLDGLDEMPVGDRTMTPQEIIKRQLQGWMSSARVVVTCRVNLWEADNNALADFETYRMLDFDVSGQEKFIRQFFQQQKSPAKAEKLQAQLKESKYQRLRDLLKNPLRLTLLCTIWQSYEAELPETQAALYQQFVQQIYIWKNDKFRTTESQREELNRGLQTLALRGLEDESSPFRLSHDLVREVLGDRDNESSLFYRALELSWLNEVGIAAEDVTQKVYSFYHATFQEYFAALAIDDWRFFWDYPIQTPLAPLSKGGTNQAPISKGTNQSPLSKGGPPSGYRIFNPQWKQVILLWLGRRDIAKEKKEEFIEALINFEDGCEGFYHYRAYCLAAAATAELKEGSRNQEIIRQIIRRSLGELNPNEWKCSKGLKDPKAIQARIFLQESDRQQTIAGLRDILRNTHSEDTRRQAANSLGKIGQGNPEAIASLLDILRHSQFDETRWEAVRSLEKIAQRNPEAIAGLLDILRHSKFDETRGRVARSLGKIDPGNSEAIASLLYIIRHSQFEDTQVTAARSLGEIDPGNSEAIASLLEIIRHSQVEETRTIAARSLGEISQGNPEAIASLLDIIRDSPVEETWTIAARSLGEIGAVNSETIASLVDIVCNSKSEETRWEAAKTLKKIGQGNLEAKASLREILYNSQCEEARILAADCLGKIHPGNSEAIASLRDTLCNSNSENTRMRAAESLGEIEPGNSEAIAGLLYIIWNTQDEETRWEAVRCLEKIGQGNSEAIASLRDILYKSKLEDTRVTAARSLGKIDPGNSEAIACLRDILRNCHSEYTRMRAIESLGEIGQGNSEAIAALLDILCNSKSENTRMRAAESLGEIGQGNPEAIAGLLEILRNSEDENSRSQVAEKLGKIASVSSEAIAGLLYIICTSQSEQTRLKAVRGLGKVAKTDEQIGEVILGLKAYICQEISQNQRSFFNAVYRVLWNWAQTLPYPLFYEAWSR